MKKEEHEKALEEHQRNLNRAIDEGIEENQRNIGYNVSQASIELFAIYLHSLHFVEGSGDQWDHRWFKNKKKMELKLPSEFPEKEKIVSVMESIEKERNAICYGTRKPLWRVEKIINNFNQLKELTEKGIKNEQKK